MSTGFLKPTGIIPGADVAGRVEAVGKGVSQFKPGDEVFGDLSGCGWGSFAEYVCANENALLLKPTSITLEHAAALPVAGVAALQGLRNKGQIKPGQKVLINGASGGVGSFAVQIAKAFGAEVTGVCSTKKVESILAVIVTNEEARAYVKGRRFADLLNKPDIGWVASDTGMGDTSGSVVDDGKNEDGAKEHIVGLQQITTPESMGVILEKCRARLRTGTRWTQPAEVTLNGTSSNWSADFEQFALNALRAPRMIFRDHALD
jgi:hypothetical protein